jgi:L-threonylcarbamoyladenylate synthase
LYPTDTIWGLGCDATNEAAVQKIYSIKKRMESKSLIILLPEAKDILKHVANPPINLEEILEQHSKPTTIIYPNALGIAENAIANDGSAAIRICKETFCYALLKRFQKPIISTSANISGEKAPNIFLEINNSIKNAVDYIVEYRQEDSSIQKPSAILLLKADDSFEIIRE